MRLVIASRKSDLARIQAYAVGEALQKKNPELQIEYHFRESLGDKNLQDPLWKMPARGVFTEDFHRGLVARDYDMVVHSWKDLPVEDRQGTHIAATLPREDARDLLLVKRSAIGDHESFRILSSSPRRAHNISQFLPAFLPFHVANLQFESVRGNVQTRVQKLLEGEAHALIVAKAALDRLLSAQRPEFEPTQTFLRSALESLQWMILPLTLNPTAAAQGALAIETVDTREDLKKLLSSIHCEETMRAVEEERRTLKSWGGGCHQKIGITVLRRPYGKITFARGQRDTGETILIERLERSQPFIPGPYFANSGKALWFERKHLPFHEDTVADINAHWISKAEAVPVSKLFDEREELVWVSGLRTWERLAARGVWVNGSSESLGEHESLRLGVLDTHPRRWGKWTHQEGPAFLNGVNVSTYVLEPKPQVPVFSESDQHFYWMSGSSFNEALKHYPWLLHKEHWCGPGNTYEAIRARLAAEGGRGAVHVAFNLDQWQKLMELSR